jgi:hypothetical protein
MKNARQLIKRTAAEIAIILLLHSALLYWLANKQIVAAMLSAGDHLPIGWVGLAIVFIIVRFFALVLLPGFILQRLLQVAFNLFVERSYTVSEIPAQPAKVSPSSSNP